MKWDSNVSFIMAAVGQAVGLGNLLRFPYVCYKHGGGLFFVPYLLCLFLLGLPTLMLELALGQKTQRGNIGAFRAIHPKLAGVGIAQVFAASVGTISYCVTIGISVVYFAAAFDNPLPWSA